MKKSLLVKYIKGDVTTQERESVVSWIDKSKDNKAYYISLMNLHVMENVSREHPAGGNMSNALKEESFRIINAQRVKKISGREKIQSGMWKWVSCAAVALLMVSVAVNLYQFGGEKKAVVVVNKVPAVEDVIHTYYTENGVKGKIILPDSSVVWLNSGSKITYPKNFDSDKRSVAFEGEGYFDVVRNPEWPMEVVTPKGMKIRVLGTKFHIKSYSNDNDEQATLFSGRIDISKTEGTKRVINPRELKPLESLRFTEKGRAVLTPAADTTKKVAWKRGELFFDQTPMPEVVKMLERWHGVKVIINDPSVLSLKYSADFSSESIIQIMELFRFTSPIDYTVEEHKIYIKKRNI